MLPYVSTANVARDMDMLRRAVGDRRLSYLGLSYGTYLGATYASLFPHSYRALALEGALDPDRYANDPIDLRTSLMAAQERALRRFLAACASDQPACSGFGGDDPGASLDALIARLDARPLAVDGRPLDGDDVRVALGGGLHAISRWGLLGRALAAGQRGDGTLLRELADGFYGRTPDGGQRPMLDQFFAVSAVDQRNPPGLRPISRRAPTPGALSVTRTSSAATPSTPGAPTPCRREGSSAARSARPHPPRRRSWSAPPTTRPRRTRTR